MTRRLRLARSLQRRARGQIWTASDDLCESGAQAGRAQCPSLNSRTPEFIGENPRVTEETGLRVKVIVEYPYKIFYGVRLDLTEILHV